MSVHSLIFVVQLIGLARGAFAQTPPQPVSAAITNAHLEDTEERVAEAFQRNSCKDIRALADQQVVQQARASVLAVFAYCEIPHYESEPLFQRAEALEPGSETIALLHARYRWKLDPASSIELWSRVLLLARNPTIKSLANDYILGVSNADEERLNLDRGRTYYARGQLGYGYATNPGVSAYSAGADTPSAETLLIADLSYQKTFGIGYVGVNGATNNSFFQSQADFNFSTHQLAVPFGLYAGNDADIVVQPYVSLSTLGPSPFQNIYGLSVAGIAYRTNYRQSVKGSAFYDHFADPVLQPQEGLHFRFDYDWEFFVPRWFYRFGLTAEHVKASQNYTDDENSVSGSQALISYSHTDFGLIGTVERSFRNFSIGLVPEFLVRIDSDLSTYTLANGGDPVSRRRQDLQASLRTNLTYTASSQLQALLWYEWTRTFSNFGPRDFIDYNVENQTVMLAVQATLRSL